tara:strand:+ start:707 stop:859 length:153 start_codon:yes stop_codon:yes gene_type:complete
MIAKTKASPVINGKSVLSAAITDSRPRPGQANTVSTTTVPVRKLASNMAA